MDDAVFLEVVKKQGDDIKFLSRTVTALFVIAFTLLILIIVVPYALCP